jgi:hypothetical protein
MLLVWDFEPEGDDPEAELAQLVQPLLRAARNVSLVLGSSESVDLVAEVTHGRAERVPARSAAEFAMAAADVWRRTHGADDTSKGG